ncbi:hypothetical protein ACFWM5_39320 [Streptomyces bobili]|uniref:hypothetical protein n=1 Tax=Streptomyces bobili TaxID=67280 RepID=UPI003650657E
MEYRRAAIPAVAGGLMVTLLLWWAGASAEALRLEGANDVLGFAAVADLQRWLLPWAYDPSGTAGGYADGTGASRYLDLYHTAIQIRFAAVFVLYTAGALLLIRRLPAERGRRTWAVLLALWAWGLVTATLAVTVSAPWLIAAGGHGSYRFLPQLASASSAGRQIAVPVALVTAAWTVFVARLALKGTEPQPRENAPARPAVLAATAGTAVVAVSLIVLSYQSNAASLQTAFTGTGRFGEPGDLLRQWLLLGAWSGPAGAPLGDWLLYRLGDVLLLAVVWCTLRWLPGLLTRVSVPAMAAGGICATVLGLLAAQSLRMAHDGTGTSSGLLYVASGLGEGVTAALLWGALAGVAATVTLRAAGGRTAAPSA